MKIVLTGGGSAGHFYPLIAIAEEINELSAERRLLDVRLYYFSTAPYDKKLLFENDIAFKRVFAGKMRVYFSPKNITGLFSLALGILKAVWDIFILYPDVVISKGGYASVPAVFAARILRIPVIVHESDSVPGRANKRAARFAARVAVSWSEAAKHFPAEKTAVTGQPIRKSILHPVREGSREYLKIEPGAPIILVLGGSQGARLINETLLEILPQLVEKYYIIHQTGRKNIKEISGLANVVLADSKHKDRYKPFGYLNDLALKMSAGIATIVITRAGSTLFEIAAWGKPSIVIPITESHGDHQRRNAFNYARTGACQVIGEQNLTQHVLLADIERIMEDEELLNAMGEAAKKFFTPDAAEKIAEEALGIALRHEL